MRGQAPPPYFYRLGRLLVGLFTGKTILITGGTGSLGRQLIQKILPQNPKRLIIFSRDELKQHEMRQMWPDDTGSAVRYFIGDVRDKERLQRAFAGVDIVVHAAALKQVPACQYNPAEAVKTNIQGSQNVIDAAINCGVGRVLLVSSDKACSPSNLYGKTKAVAEDLFIQGNAYSPGKTLLSVCRYGNVVGSRGSVVPLFRQLAQTGRITITDPRMTRFWLSLSEAADLVEHSLTHMRGGEIFIPKLPSMKVVDLAAAIAPGVPVVITGIRPGEKLGEALLSDEEIAHTIDAGSVYVVQPQHSWWTAEQAKGDPLPDGFRYSSDVNDRWLSVQDLEALCEAVPS